MPDDWFVVNLRDTQWFRSEAFGTSALYRPPSEWPELGINVGVLEPGKPNCLYHEETVQEAFLVLAGECVLVVEGEERRLHAWDFFHCPPGTRHAFVGAGDGPCAIVFIGARRPDQGVVYRADPVAARHGAAVAADTPDPAEAYAGSDVYEPVAAPAGTPWSVE